MKLSISSAFGKSFLINLWALRLLSQSHNTSTFFLLFQASVLAVVVIGRFALKSVLIELINSTISSLLIFLSDR